MPLGDTAVASAQAATLDQAMPESSVTEDAQLTEEPGETAAPETGLEETAPEAEQPEAETEQPKPSPKPEAPSAPRPQSAPRALAAQNALSCVAGNVYSVSSNGALQHISVSGDVGNVRNVGTRAQNVSSFNGLGIGDEGRAVYAYERTSSRSNTVYRFDTSSQTWGVATKREFSASDANVSSLVAGAVDSDGRYWVGGFNSSRNFQLWAMNDAGTAMEQRGQADLSSRGWSSADGNGDMAFDTLGNLYIVRGKSTGNALDVFRVNPGDLIKGTGVNRIRVAANENTNNSPFNGVNGVAYDASGKLFLGGSWSSNWTTTNSIGYMPLPLATNATPKSLRLTGVSLSTTDLASCGYPPTVKLQKNLPDGRVAPTDQFKLELKSVDVAQGNRETTLGTINTAGSDVGVQEQVLGPIPVAAGGSISITESVIGNTGPGNYASRWQCAVGDTVIAEGTGRSNDTPILIPTTTQGKEVLCTFTNTVAQAKKTAVPASGTAVDRDDARGGIVRYTLSFDNLTGPTATDILYSDYLSDVLDDAVFVDSKGNESKVPVVQTTGGIVYDAAKHWNADKKILRVEGKAAKNSTASLSFSVRVLPNDTDSDARQASSNSTTSPQGYFLRNKLARGTADTPPAECKPGFCTEHPINAWTVTKDSLPADGARLHKGGNVHYKVTAKKANAGTVLNGLVLQDDLTHVFKSAGWAPGAMVPGGANGKGVYLFNEDNRTIGLDGKPNTENPGQLRSVQDVAAPELRNFAAPGAPEDMRWIVTSGAPINMPKEAERAEMWFAVVAAESPAGIPNPSIWVGQGKAPASGWVFANYATGMAAKQPGSNGGFAPNECATGTTVPDTSAAPNSAQPIDTKFPSTCRTQHEVSQNYFTIRKDAGGAGVQDLADDASWDPDPTGLWNMVGHEFEIRDTDAKTGKATSYPSVKLCRTDYDPYSATKPWTGKWVSAANATDTTRFAFGADGAEIQQNIIRWNNEHPALEDQLPVCGTIYPISSGAQKGRWRSENLEAGDYWLMETKAPNAQAAVDATTKSPRPVPGVQRLAQPVPFKIWPEADGPVIGESSMQGRGQLDVGNGSGGYLDRCNPGQQEEGEFLPGGTVAERPTACVNPTGYLMLVKDPAPTPLPLTGGVGPWMLWGSGAVVLLLASAGIIWWRVRRPVAPRHGA